MRQGVVGGGHCHGPPLSMSGWGEGMRWELRDEATRSGYYTMGSSAPLPINNCSSIPEKV